LDGGEGADVINGDAGDDFLKGGEGSDTLNGGDGQDVAIFNRTQADYQISRSTIEDDSTQLIIKYVGKDINEGVDILNGIEMLKFGDDEAVNVVDVVDTVIAVVGIAAIPVL
jgi:Ca2+-binding RTX toxin-like protein